MNKSFNNMKIFLRFLLYYSTFLISEIRKNLTKITKENSCDELSAWIQPCVNHLHCSAATTPDGNGQLISVRFKSFLSHVVDTHTNLADPLFNKCAYEENLACRKYLD